MKKNYKLLKHYFVLAAVLFTFIAQQTAAQAPQIQWAKCFGGSSNDRATDIHRTSDSGYVVCGFTNSNDGQVTDNHGGIDGWVIKLDVDGNLQWQKTYGGTGDDALNAIRQLSDGGYIAVGYADTADGDIDSSHGAKDFWVVRTDGSGAIIWENTFGGSGDDVANDIATTADTGFVVVGYTWSDDGQVDNYKGAGDGWIVYVDTLGHLIREKDKGGHAYDEFKSVITAGNGGFIVAGLSRSNNGTLAGLNHGGSDAWVARLSKFGTDQWNILVGDSLDDGAYDVHEDENNHFVVSGHRDFFGQNDSWLFTVDSLGAFLSESTHGGTDQELDGASIEKTLSNYIVAASSNSAPSGDKDCLYGGYDFWMYNTLSAGAITWQKCMGGTAEDICSRGQASPDGSIGLCGYTNSTDLDVIDNHGDYDFWVLRLLDGCDVTAGFTYTQSGLSFSFTNTSFDAVSFFWTFGDGSTSTEINPTHVYADSGIYTVCLISSSLCAVDTTCTQIIIGCIPVSAGFTFTTSGLNAQFTDLSGTATSWQWTFGDGGSSNAQNPAYTYTNAGTYTVCLIASNDCSIDTFCTDVTVECSLVSYGFDFTVDGLTASFTDLSSGATSWQWTFGDGNTSNLQNPSNTYSTAGTYTVCLIVSNDCASDTFCQDVTVECAQVTAGFSFLASSLTVSFSDLSVGATSWEWTFGDGGTSNAQNPTYTYSTDGTFTVCLIASNECSIDTFCTEVTVECISVIAGFNFAANGLDVQFLDASVAATGWSWTFGDGNTSIGQNPIHTYLNSGTYTVCLIASNSCSLDTLCTEVTVECAQVAAGFTFTTSDLNVLFTDLSGGATSWQWDFGDGNTSNVQNPGNTYAASGTYTVCLIASNECSIDTFCTDVTVCAVVSAAFDSSANGLNVSFTDLSVNATSWQWTFGDGNTSNLQNPSNQYSAPGTYLVCLFASNDCSTDSACISITVDFGVGTGAVNSQSSSFNIYPNPFSDEATISFTVTENSPVTITLTDVQGRLLRTVLSEILSAGDHAVMIPKKNLPAGIYLLQLKQGSESVVRRLVIE
ncbi:MAG TPA: PKD domain-containing protein [Chitinophagales bacterium]|nr:PKD domain-containing protein [Chitinophagales bacterium]